MNDHVAKPIDPALLYETVGRFYQPGPEPEADAGRAAETPPREAPPAPSVTEAGSIPTVEGLDTADGLLRVAGNRTLYLKLLRQFVAQQVAAPGQIAEALGAGNHAAAERLAHTVKGVAGNLGAGPVRTAAGALEQAIAGRGDASGIEDLRQRLAQELEALIGRLRPALGDDAAGARSEAPAAPADPEILKALVTQMHKQLSEFDPGAADVLESNRDAFRSLLGGEDFAAFEGHIQGYAFSDAQALLERAATARGI
jgi:HPt (histidine-containing phosphotransfer) domain-containing protein